MEPIHITFNFLEDEGYLSVTDFCRYLLTTGGKFENIHIHVYREEMLCLIVNDIEKAAAMMPKDCRWIKYDATRRKDVQEPR